METLNISKYEYYRIMKAVFLLLGPSCNMSCRHCTQIPIKNTFNLKPTHILSKNVINFLQEWVTLTPNITSKRIYFWGGEPLLYWNTIKKTILLFEEINIYPITYVIFSNGLLLNDKIADFCNNHNILFKMSYDAPNPLAVRNNIPSEENIKSFLKINKRNINFVYNAINHNISEAFNMLEQKFAETYISMGLINVLNSSMPLDVYDFNESQIEEDFNKLTNDIIDGKDIYFNRYNFMVNRFKMDDIFDNELFIEQPWPPCAPGLCSLSLTFNGDIIRCHNDNKVIGNINDSYLNIINNHLNIWNKLLPKKCLNCEVVSMCRNICPIAAKKGDEYIHCNHLRKIYSAIKNNKERLINAKLKPPIKKFKFFGVP